SGPGVGRVRQSGVIRIHLRLTSASQSGTLPPRSPAAADPLTPVPPLHGGMDIILIPGFWLDASSWDEVAPALEQAGHRVRALTLPGLESADADRRGIGLRDH